MSLLKHLLPNRSVLSPAQTFGAVLGLLSAYNAVPTARAAQNVDFGPNVAVFDATTPPDKIQAKLDEVFKVQEANQFGKERNAILFKPGHYSFNANVGFYTQVSGLGFSPEDVDVKGLVRAEADWFHDNGTCNFWRVAENMSVTPTDGNNRWAVSQAAPMRRMHIKGKLQLDPRGHGWSSGGFIADSVVDGQVSSGSQQQYLCRNCTFGSWSGSVWNMEFVGVQGAPSQHFPKPAHTVIDKTPVIREKPFLYVDNSGNYQVFVPELRKDVAGTTWNGHQPSGQSIPLSQFLVVKPGMGAAEMNAALTQGLNLLITPGIYHVNQTIAINRPNTVVLGMGMATLTPDNGVVAMKVGDVDGVKVAGILFDAGAVNSPVMFEVGNAGSTLSHATNPTSIHDIFSRIGGASAGKATVSLRVNSKDTIVDHIWLWRADHGDGVGWTINPAEYGIVVNGENVTGYGLFSEHFEKNSLLWNANGGRVYFYQNEMPYDPTKQSDFMNGQTEGYPSYKVADGVTTHEGWGLGSYCYFNVDPSIKSDHAFEVPDKPGVKLHDVLTVSLGGKGSITHVVNKTGETAQGNKTIPVSLPEYPAKAP